MPIEQDATPNQDEVMNAFGSNFNDTAQMIFNADYIGFDSRLNNNNTPDLKNVFYDTFTSDSEVDRANTTMYYDDLNDIWYVADTIDDTNNGTVDASLWSTVGTVTEGTSTNPEDASLLINQVNVGTAEATLDGGSAPNLKTEDSSMFFRYSTSSSGNGGKKARIILSDGSNDVVIFSQNVVGTNQLGKNNLYRLDIDISAETIDLFEGNTQILTNTDISSLTGGTWSIRFESESETSSMNVNSNIIYINRVIASSGTGDLVLDAQSTSETVTNLILVVNEDKSTNASATFFVAADGTTFESVSNITIHRPSTTGTSIKVKITGDPNKQTDVFDFYKVTEEAIKYNFY